jgi:hypothetical protein
MMTSDQPELCRLERPIEIYENERLWIGRGFSKAGLLPTERGPYSTQDGSLSWKSMREASLALLRGDVASSFDNKEWYNNGKTDDTDAAAAKKAICRRGWSFHEENSDEQDADDYECSTTQTNNGNSTSSDNMSDDEYWGFVPCCGAEDGPSDEDGWQYFPDFKEQSLSYPNRKRGLLDFVRRRKLRRMAMFRPDHFLPRDVYNKCDYCDSRAVQVLSDAILDALSLASLFAYGPANPEKVTDAQVIPLKSKLIDTLQIGRNWRSDSKTEEDTNNLDDVRERLCTFAEKSIGKPGPIMHLLNPDVDKSIQAIQPLRRKVIAKYFTDHERVSLARLLIKDIDRDAYELHCKNETCASLIHAGSHHGSKQDDSTACPFHYIPCPNYKCTVQISKKYTKEHDEECGYKLLPCPSGCGIEVARNDMHVHVTTRCSLRQAECPLSIVGCTATVQAADVTKHLNQHADTHLMLLSTRMMEYQTLFKQFDSKIKILEEKNAKLERELARNTALLSTKNESNVISNDLKKVTKRLNALEKKVAHDRRSHTK